MVRSYLAALGNPQETGRQAEVIAAAEMQVLAEEARAVALRDPGNAVLLNSAVRVQRAADQALRRLGIKATGDRHSHHVTGSYKSVEEYKAAAERRAAAKALGNGS
ncbi:MAG: hypothetical protein WA465_06880 [Methylovirgula sp.]